MADTELLIQIKADVDDLKKGFKNAEKHLADFQKSSKETAKDSNKSFLSMKNIAETALGFGVANAAQIGVRAIKDFAVDSVKSAIKAERAMQSFKIVAGATADVLLTDLRKASRGLVSDLDLVSAANRALALGIDKNQLPKLLEVATARAKVMGITTSQAFNDIATGIGRQSKLILDNLGIIVNLDKAYQNYALSVGRSVESLSEFEKKQIISNEIIKSTEGLIFATSFATETAADKVEKLGAAWDNFKINVGTAIVTIGMDIDEFGARVTALGDENFQEMSEAGKSFMQSLGVEVIATEDNIKALQDSVNSVFASIQSLSGQKLKGERQGNIAVLEKENELSRVQLDLNQLRQQGLEEQDPQILAVKTRIEELRLKLEELRLTQELEFNKFKEINTEKLTAFAEESLGITKTKDDWLKSGEEIREDLGKNLLELEKERAKIEEINEAALRARDRFNELLSFGEKLERLNIAASKIGSRFQPAPNIGRLKKAGDFILKPDGQMIETDPRDTIIGFKGNNPAAGNVSITINAPNANAQEVFRIMKRELKSRGVSVA